MKLQHGAMAFFVMITLFGWWPCSLYGVPVSQAGVAGAPLVAGSTVKTSDDLDSQLLEGVGEQPNAGNTSQARTQERADSREEPDGIIDPFARGSDIGGENPLSRLSGAMQRVEKLLSERKVKVETQVAQREIIDQLDSLIAALASSQSTQSQRQRQPSPGAQGEQSGTETGREAARGDGGEDEESGTDIVPAPGTTFPVGEIWGHLPERYRRQVRSASAIEFLPKYRKLIEDYYKRLAEDRGGSP